MRAYSIALGAALWVGACDRAPEVERQSRPPDEQSASKPAEAGKPQERTSLAEPKGPIDPNSAEAAGQVVQSYGALIEQEKFGEAEALWGSKAAARAFAKALLSYPEVHLEIRRPGRPEGAAGSVYVTVPVVFYGKLQTEAAFRRPAKVTLRRVNDVPGSTEEQRRWHIERVEWVGG